MTITSLSDIDDHFGKCKMTITSLSDIDDHFGKCKMTITSLSDIDDHFVREKLRENVQYRQRFRYPPSPWPADHPAEVKVSQSELPPRRPRDSFVNCFVPMSDPRERSRYLRHGGGIRFARFLEDLDTLAGVICYKHDYNPAMKGLDNKNSPYAFMTVLVDSIEHAKNQPALTEDKDVYLNGKVTWVGTSSMECTMNIGQVLTKQGSGRRGYSLITEWGSKQEYSVITE
ncbi:acyl-coenzyme A thioesterase 9, mitochondrial [Elysia marginata]|uniref:Acyl-coenzyme A thioesterase 9, mitochondrial n=1 Tax=Elysia marginata TaxID=1093978 RepID=A0AAV4GKR7_9GAST|nr:acyl-coenzyme A thioesterase 9, mitochondrial [Elysia marginata]